MAPITERASVENGEEGLSAKDTSHTNQMMLTQTCFKSMWVRGGSLRTQRRRWILSPRKKSCPGASTLFQVLMDIQAVAMTSRWSTTG